MVTDFCKDGDLHRLIRASKAGIPERKALGLALDVARALQKAKEEGIVHRDIKPENVLLEGGKAKLGDFGFAISRSELAESKQGNVGSPLYMPLEVLKGNNYSPESDLFAFGVLFYEMLHGRTPWECGDERELLRKMQNEPVSFGRGVSDGVKELIRSCLAKDSTDRGTIEDVISSPVFQSANDSPACEAC